MEIARLEQELEARHVQELASVVSVQTKAAITPESEFAALNLQSTPSHAAGGGAEDLNSGGGVGGLGKMSKAEKRRKKRDEEMERIMAEARAEAAGQTDYKKLENDAISDIICDLHLKIHQVSFFYCFKNYKLIITSRD